MATILSLNWFDLVLAIVIVTSAVAGLRTGFARVVVGLAATIVGCLAGFWCYRMVAAKFAPWIATPALANILGFLIIFVGIAILGALIAALLSRLLKWVGLSWFNHLLGGAAGFLRGVLVIAVLASVLVAFAPSPTPAYLQNSRVLPYANSLAALLAELAPQQLKDSFLQQMENLKQFQAAHTPQHSSAI
ncbi:MAG TPA: CvpA family protein [Bryobacteraceae bacterium]|jgi:membrane protein required for colicin V production